MTIAGWVPWPLDTRDPEPAPGAAFDTYVHQDSVLLTAKERPRRQVPGWRAWLPTDPKRRPLRRACPTCLSTAAAGTFGFTLVSQLPLTISCPQHSCLLEPAFGGLGAFVAWEEQDTRARAAPAPVVVLDARTHEGLRTGTVLLPRRSVHAGVVGPWRPYEALPWDRQQTIVEAPATALHLIEVGEVTAHGTLAPLLTPAPHRTVPTAPHPLLARVTTGRRPGLR